MTDKMHDEIMLYKVLEKGLLDERLAKIVRTILKDGEKSLSSEDFAYYCCKIPDLIRMMMYI